MTRNGKIARLPLPIREELNQRLQNGEPGNQLVEWLNSLPEVQAVMKAEFDGQPIAENNLSAWKTGGYLAWEQDQITQQELASFLEKAGALQQAAKEGLTDRMTLFLAAKMALEFNRLDSVPDGEEKSKILRELLGSLVLLRRRELHGEKLRLDRQKYDDRHRKQREEKRLRREERRESHMTAEEKEARINEIMGVD
jgi:hypothetical protein